MYYILGFAFIVVWLCTGRDATLIAAALFTIAGALLARSSKK